MLTIIGNGAIGNLVALHCQYLDLEYCVISRNQQPAKIHCKTSDEEINLTPTYQSIDAPICEGMLILPLKAYQVMPAIKQFRGQLAANVPVVLLHNGMVDHQQILQLLPNNPILVATTSYGSFKPRYDSLNVTGIGATQAGWLRDSNKNQYFQNMFEKILPPCSWHHNIMQILWRKLAVNCVINPLTALHNIRNGELAHTQYCSTIMGVTDEITQIMNGLNIPVKRHELFENCMGIIEKTALNYSSMHQDVQYKRKTEIENINGYVVGQSELLRIPAPLNEGLFQQIKKIETYSC